jgi:hypothetical protein
MNSLILKPTGSHYGREWSGDDFVVLLDREVVGRIMLHPQAPKEQPWFWTITSLECRRQFTIAATQQRANKRWRISKQDG